MAGITQQAPLFSINKTLSGFSLDEKNVNYLKSATSAIREGFFDMQLFVLEVNETNARTARTFTNATCNTRLHTSREGNRAMRIQAGSIFKEGLHTLEMFLDRDNPRIADDVIIQNAFAKLVRFLNGNHDCLLSSLRKERIKESELAAVFAQHLLCPLTGGTYLIDAYYQDLPEPLKQCSCDEIDEVLGRSGDTSFGCQNGWHGRSDILLENIPVTVQSTEAGDDSASEIESKAFTTPDEEQLKAQTIVFSFLQHKLKGCLNNFLIPGIGLSPGHVIVYFYDCVEDVFLTSAKLSLLDGERNGHLNWVVAVFLWLVLNYDIFCTGAPEQVKQYKAGFHRKVEDCLDMYVSNVDRHVCGHSTEDEEDLEIMKKCVLPFPEYAEYDTYISNTRYISLNSDTHCSSSS